MYKVLVDSYAHVKKVIGEASKPKDFESEEAGIYIDRLNLCLASEFLIYFEEEDIFLIDKLDCFSIKILKLYYIGQQKIKKFLKKILKTEREYYD
jgi:hypothetical protein